MRLVQYVKYQTGSTVTPRGKSSRGYRATATGDTEIQSTRILIQTARNRREQNLQMEERTVSLGTGRFSAIHVFQGEIEKSRTLARDVLRGS